MSHSETLTSGMEEDSYINTAGLGYGIAIAVGILVLVSSIMLASYVCIRVHGRRRRGIMLINIPKKQGECGQ